MLFFAPPPSLNPTSILGDTTPSTEGTVATAGSRPLASREDHKHPRISSAGSGVLNASGEATITFTRQFTTAPAVFMTAIEATGEPIIFKVKSWLGPAGAAYVSGDYYGCVVKAHRLNALPASIALLTVLINFSVSSGSTTGVNFCYTAIMPS